MATPLSFIWIKRLLRSAMEQPEVTERIGQGSSSLNVWITTAAELQRLNRCFLGHNYPTDVLSFPTVDSLPLAERGRWGRSGHLGDLAVSWPAVVEQARSYGHTPRVEAGLLLIHGFLHLLGWDHAEPAEEQEMTRLTLSCLARSGLHPSSRRYTG